MGDNQKESSSYKQILKATSVYGGVQVFSILISIIRSKTIALWLGPSGMGIFAIFNSFITLTGSLFNLGLSTSAVKNIAAAHAAKDEQLLNRTITVLQKILLFSGILGFLSTILLSRFLSQLNFTNTDYTWSFVLISVVILLNQLQQGRTIVLQGTQKIKQLAKASFYGLLLGLIVNLPMFYIWREKAIAPSIVVSSILSLVTVSYFSKSRNFTRILLSFEELKREGAGMIKMGVLISLTALATQFSSYIVRLFILKTGNVSDLGLYSSGFALISTYFGMIFTAMGTDYYPRLSKIVNNHEQAFFEMNRQAEVAILILSPLLCIFLIFVEIAIVILLSKEFLAIVPMVRWAVIGIFFQACSWSIAFIFLAKGHSKQFLINEVITITYLLGINIACYYWKGLVGLGIAFAVMYLIYTIHMMIVANRLYGFYFSRNTVRILIFQFVLILLSFGASFLPPFPMYVLGVIVIFLSTLYSIQQLDKVMGVKAMLRSKFRAMKR